ncbi:MAG: TIGR03986 family type III CRISPR-associated RAMP protein [Gammaproteobacteria bacterium]
MMEKGEIKIINHDRKFGFIKPDSGGKDIHFPAYVLERPARWEELKPGVRVEFERKMGARGPTATVVRVMGSATQDPTVQARQTGYRFLNPYNFARYLPPGVESAEKSVQLLGRCVPPPHDRWVGISGTIHCRLTAITPIFVADAETVQADKENKEHKHYQFFRWDGKKAVPSASLRGPVRAVFETITNSCFANLADKRLSYRMSGREIRNLVPARVEREESERGERWTLRLLTGSSSVWRYGEAPRELYPSGVRRYAPITVKFKRDRPPDADINFLKHGEECWAVMTKMPFPPAWRTVVLRHAQTEARQELAGRLRSGEIKEDCQPRVAHGWYCETNQNADNKHSERFFFRDPGARGLPESIDLRERVRHNYEDLIVDYQDRHEREVSKRGERSREVVHEGEWKDEIAFSRFVLNRQERKLRGGELVYAQLEGHATNPSVRFIAPVSWPRVAYERTVGELLVAHAKHLRRCESDTQLCPACRTFGWVHGGEKEGAYRGRLRFGHATLAKEGAQIGPYRLAILSTPKPTTTRFYLVAPDGRPRDGRSDAEAGYDGEGGENRLRGRKFYRHFTPKPQPVAKGSDQNRTIIDPEGASVGKPTDQNRTITDPEGAGAEFDFKVEFENLAEVELGALLWALTLGQQGYHRLGYGKPLGLGSAQVEVTAVETLDPQARYLRLADSGYANAERWPRWIESFQEAAAARWGKSFHELEPVADLLALLKRAEPALPVHYPYSPAQGVGQKQFEWFVGNKHGRGPKLELGLAIEDEGLPLISKDGSVKW